MTNEEKIERRRIAQAKYQAVKGRIARRKWASTAKGKACHYACNVRYRQKLKNKEVIVPAVSVFSEVCSIKNCNKPAERHHPNYETPEHFVWLCREHHRAIHGKGRSDCLICGARAHAKKLCMKHYKQQWYKNNRG